MFSKLLENAELPFNQQKNILKSIIQTNLKQNLPEVRLQFNHNYLALKPILLNHWKYSLHISLSLISWQIARDYIQGQSDNKVFDLLLALSALNNKKIYEYIVLDLVKVFSDQWRQLVIVAFIGEFVTPRILVEDYCWFISGFVRLSALTIQNYLKLKNENASSSEDRLENDGVLLKNCEKWVASSYVKMISRLKRPQKAAQKLILASAFSQIAGALYEIQREQQINDQHLLQIFTPLTIYIFAHYRLDQIIKIFIDRLISMNYNNPLKKIEIPQRYDQKSDISTSGICLLINQFVSNFGEILSPDVQLNAYLIIYSEILCTPFKLKEEILPRIKEIWAKIPYNPNLENQYPLALLLFNVFHYNKAEYEYIAQKTTFNSSKAIKINQLKRLLMINIDKLNVQKTEFIVNNLDEACLAQKQVLFLIKVISFDFINVQLGTLIVNLYEKIQKHHSELMKKVIKDVIKRERLAKHNLQLCQQIQKKFLKG